jgi:hypothetical protein
VETKVHCCVHKRPPIVPALSQVNSVYIFPSFILEPILILSCHLCLGLSSGLFLSGLPVCVFVFLMCATCPTHLILDLIIIMFGKREQQPRKFICKGYLFLASAVFKQKARGDLLVQQQRGQWWTKQNQCSTRATSTNSARPVHRTQYLE